MNKALLKEIILTQQHIFNQSSEGISRDILPAINHYLKLPHTLIISGLRRAGKSTLLKQIIHYYFHDEGFYYLTFEDERLLHFSAENFNDLYEVFVELYGEKTVFCLDEIQNIPHWESFVRRLQDAGFKFIITGSNASLLSKELGTKLTGRHVLSTLYPFSLNEYLKFRKFNLAKDIFYNTEQRAILKKEFLVYLQNGGIPEFVKYQDSVILKGIYEDVIFRDILTRFDIKDLKTFRELAFYLLTNTACLFSYNKLKNLFQVGSVNTIKNYIDHLENSYLFFTVTKFAFSLKEQAIANKKIYCIDNGFIEAIGFSFSKNIGKYLENIVFLELKRRSENDIYYYKTENNLEVDFLIKNQNGYQLIQVTETLEPPDTKARELKALLTAMKELKIQKALILTLDEENEVNDGDSCINIVPVYKWLLNDSFDN